MPSKRQFFTQAARAIVPFVLCLGLGTRAAEPIPTLSAEDFARPEEMGSIKFSPNGARFAATAERKGQVVLVVVDYATNKART